MSTILHARHIRVQRRPAYLILFFALILLLLSGLAAGRGRNFKSSPPQYSPPAVTRQSAFPESYRGYRIETAGRGLSIPELELAAADYGTLCHAANRLLFRSRSGAVDPELEKRLAAADRNGDLYLSSAERDHFLSRVPLAYRGLLGEHLSYYWGPLKEEGGMS